jgi:hypothetical protein
LKHNVFDQLFYITYSQYEKWKEDTPYPFAVAIVCLTQFGFINTITDILSLFGLFPKIPLVDLKYIAVVLLGFLWMYNNRRYRHNYLDIMRLQERLYHNESAIKTMYIYVMVAFVLLFPILVAFMRHNLGLPI